MRAILSLLAAALLAGCGSDDDVSTRTVPRDAAPQDTPTTGPSTSVAHPVSSPTTTSASASGADPVAATTTTRASTDGTVAAERSEPTADAMLAATQRFFSAMEHGDFTDASALFVDDWTFESFGGGTITGRDGDDLVEVLGFNGTVLTFAPGSCGAEPTARPPTVRCHDNRAHGPLPAALGIVESFPLPLDLLFSRDGRLVGVLPNRAALERHPEAGATVAVSSRVGLDLTAWVVETQTDADDLLRPPGRALVPTRQNADRVIELAGMYVDDSG